MKILVSTCAAAAQAAPTAKASPTAKTSTRGKVQKTKYEKAQPEAQKKVRTYLESVLKTISCKDVAGNVYTGAKASLGKPGVIQLAIAKDKKNIDVEVSLSPRGSINGLRISGTTVTITGSMLQKRKTLMLALRKAASWSSPAMQALGYAGKARANTAPKDDNGLKLSALTVEQREKLYRKIQTALGPKLKLQDGPKPYFKLADSNLKPILIPINSVVFVGSKIVAVRVKVDSDTVRTIKVDDNFKARFVRAVVDSKKTIPDLVSHELRLRLK